MYELLYTRNIMNYSNTCMGEEFSQSEFSNLYTTRW